MASLESREKIRWEMQEEAKLQKQYTELIKELKTFPAKYFTLEEVFLIFKYSNMTYSEGVIPILERLVTKGRLECASERIHNDR